MAYEVHCPAVLNVAKVAGTLGQQRLELGRDVLTFGGWPPKLRGVLQSWESSRLIRVEPGADGVCIAVSTPGDVGDTPALSIE
jgi:hypothetical protein